jgi:hypothetical protein
MVPVLVDKARREDRTTDDADAEDEAWLDAVLSGYEGVDLNEDDRLRKSSSSSTAGQHQGQIRSSSSSKSHPCILRRLVARLAEIWNRQ